jgi:hypothetical protein
MSWLRWPASKPGPHWEKLGKVRWVGSLGRLTETATSADVDQELAFPHPTLADFAAFCPTRQRGGWGIWPKPRTASRP